MTGFSVPAVLAVFLGVFVMPLLFVPYVAWTYRRRGIFGYGHALIVGATVVYGIALWTYTIVPLPDPATMRCDGGATAQLIPFATLADLDLAGNGLRDPALLQLAANVALFVPFGMLVRHLAAPRRVGWVVLAAAGVSLLIELTQLTGVWGLYPCSYRLFDVDDVLTNTLGATIGLALAPLLRLVPGQQAVPPDEARVVTRGRRLVGMAVDLAAVQILSVLLYLPLAIAAREAGWFGTEVPYDQLRGWVTVAVAVALLLGFPRLARGATLGQVVTYVRPVAADGSRPNVSAGLVRWMVGSGGYFVVSSLQTITGQQLLGWLATSWIALSAVVVVLRHPRGLSGYAAGLTVADARDPESRASRARDVDPRSLSMALAAVIAAAYLGFLFLTALGTLAPAVGAAFGVLGISALVLATFAVVPFLIANGVITVRREGVSLATLLPVLTAVGVVALLGLLILAMVTGAGWLIAATTGVLAATGYVGFLFLAFLVYGQWYAGRRPAGPVAAVVVLGSRVFGDRVPPLLAARIDRGVEVLDQLLRQDTDACTVLVCSGGQGPDETMPEGAAMAAYAIGQGAPTERVLAETRSRSTEENLILSRELLRQQGQDGSVIVVTNDFHAFRAAIITREVGITAQVIGARTARYYFPAAILREFVGVLARSPWLHGTVAVALAVVVGGSTALILV